MQFWRRQLALTLTFFQISTVAFSAFGSVNSECVSYLSTRSILSQDQIETSFKEAFDEKNPRPQSQIAFIEKYREFLKANPENSEILDDLTPAQNETLWNLVRQTAFSLAPLAPTPEDFKLLRSSARARDVYELALQGRRWGGVFNRVWSRFAHYVEGDRATAHFVEKNNLTRASLGALYGLYSALKWLLLLPLPQLKPTAKIFNRLKNDLRYEPTSDELQVLDRYRARDDFFERQEFRQSHPRWTVFRRWLTRSVKLALALNAVMVVNEALVMHDHRLSGDQFLDQPALRLNDTQVQLLAETVPFPHLAIRIGDTVYSYGVTHLTSHPARVYLNEGQIQRLLKEHFEGAAVEPETAPSSGSLGKQFARVEEKFGQALAKLPRSVQVVTLNMPSARARLELKHELEMGTGQRYYNNTMVNDCSTMTLRALARHGLHLNVPEIADGFPGQILLELSLRKNLYHGKAIGSIYQVDVEDPAHGEAHVLRNAYTNFLESKVMVELAALNGGLRVWVDVTRSPSQLQFKDPQAEAIVRSWKIDEQAILQNNEQVSLFKEQVSDLASVGEGNQGARKRQLRTAIENYFAAEMAQAQGETQDLDRNFKDIINGQYRIVLLQETKADLLKQLETIN